MAISSTRKRQNRIVAEVPDDVYRIYAGDRDFFGERGGSQNVVCAAMALYAILPRDERLTLSADQHPRNREEMRRLALANNPWARALMALASMSKKDREEWITELEGEE